MTANKRISIESMSAKLSKVTVKLESVGKDEPRESHAYLTFSTVLPADMLEAFDLTDIAKDTRLKPGEEVVLSNLQQGYENAIALTVSATAPVTGVVRELIDAVAAMEKMTLSGEIFSFTVSHLVFGDEDWITFGKMFSEYIGADMDVTARPDDRGKQEPLMRADVSGLGSSIEEGNTLTIATPGRKPVTVKGTKRK